MANAFFLSLLLSSSHQWCVIDSYGHFECANQILKWPHAIGLGIERMCVCIYMCALGVGRCDDKKHTQRLVYDSHYHFIVCVSGTQGKRIKIHRPRQIYNQYYNIIFHICCLNFNIASWCIDTNMNLQMRHGTKRRITLENFLNIEINFIVFTKRPDYDS